MGLRVLWQQPVLGRVLGNVAWARRPVPTWPCRPPPPPVPHLSQDSPRHLAVLFTTLQMGRDRSARKAQYMYARTHARLARARHVAPSPRVQVINPDAGLLEVLQWTLLNNSVALLGYYAAALTIDRPWMGRTRMQIMGFTWLVRHLAWLGRQGQGSDARFAVRHPSSLHQFRARTAVALDTVPWHGGWYGTGARRTVCWRVQHRQYTDSRVATALHDRHVSLHAGCGRCRGTVASFLGAAFGARCDRPTVAYCAYRLAPACSRPLRSLCCSSYVRWSTVD